MLVSGATGYTRSNTVGHLIVPRSWSPAVSLDLQPGRWAMDNGAFGGRFDAGSFVTMLERFSGLDARVRGNGCDGSTPAGCLFVTAPDVIYESGIGDAAATVEKWPFWSRLIRGLGFKPAFVAQDGLTPDMVPWAEMGALFIGGSTAFKKSSDVRSLMAYAKAQGIWTHWGRVNSKRRYALAVTAGCDSIDGSGFSMYPDTNIPKVAQWQREIQQQPTLL